MADRDSIRKITPSGVVSTLVGSKRATCAMPSQGRRNCTYTDGPAALATVYAVTLVAAPDGSIYFAGDGAVRKASPDGTVTTLAGKLSGGDFNTGPATLPPFTHATGIALGADGNLFVTDSTNVVRKITPAGAVTIIAGTIGSKQTAYADGPGATALFGTLEGLAVDGQGNLLVLDRGNYLIRRIAPDAMVSTYAGAVPVTGNADGPGHRARFEYPEVLAADGTGNVYVVDAFGDTVRKISPEGVVTTLAGSPGSGFSVDGSRASARFLRIIAIMADKNGTVLVADNSSIRQITPDGVVTTIAGSGPLAAGQVPQDGVGRAASFGVITGLAADRDGNIWIADSAMVRKLGKDGTVTTVAGTFSQTHTGYKYADGVGSAARFGALAGIAVDTAGNAYVADASMATIRKITPAGVVTTLAGRPDRSSSVDGVGVAASFGELRRLTIDAADALYVADRAWSTPQYGQGPNLVRRITLAGVVSTVAGTPGLEGALLGKLPGSLPEIRGVAGGSAGVVHVTAANAVFRITLAP